MAYTSPTLVTNEIGTNYDSTNDLTTAQVTAFVVQADSIIDAAAYEHYNPFNAHDSSATDGTDTYIVPGLIGQCSKNMAVAFGLRQLKAKKSNTTHSDTIDHFLDQAELTLAQLRAGEFVQVNTYRTQAISYVDGSEAFALGQYQSLVSPSSLLDSGDPQHILKDTFFVAACTNTTNPTQMRMGEDFGLWWDARWRNWIFEGRNSALQASGATITVTFKWDYRKDYAQEAQRSGVALAG